VIILFLLLVNIINQHEQLKINQDKVCFKSRCFNVEIADTVESRQKGLMYRDFLASNEGMLFIFDNEGIYPFWMKNTLIYLDIIWIDENKQVVYIQENALPCKEENCINYNPDKNALYVLEINAGKVKELGLKEGDNIIFHIN
jgi:uncharacterized membrane protein (UPF0127 family)